MYYCDCCNSYIDSVGHAVEPHGEPIDICPICGSDEIEAAGSCPICGDCKKESEDICQECKENLENDFSAFIGYIQKSYDLDLETATSLIYQIAFEADM